MPRRSKVLAEACPRIEQPDRPEVRERDLFWAEGQYRYKQLGALRLINRHHVEVAQNASNEVSASGFVEPSVFYPSIEDYRRFELRRRSLGIWSRFWALRQNHQFYRLVLTVRQTPCRQYHADRLETVRRFIWKRLGPLVTGHARSLHVQRGGYLHWDYVVAVEETWQPTFIDEIRDLHRQIYGSNGPRNVRLWYRRIARNPNHLSRSIDYSQRCARFFKHKERAWITEAIQADAYGCRLRLVRRRWVGFKSSQPPEEAQVECAELTTVRRGRPPKAAGPSYRRRRLQCRRDTDEPRPSLHGDR